MIWLLAACTSQVFAPDYADCTLTSQVDELADGSIERTTTTLYDAEGRVVRVTSELEGQFYEEVSTYEGDCLVESVIRSEYDNGDTYVDRNTRECDENGDPLAWERRAQATGSQSYDFEQSATWDRTYGDNGLTSEALRVDTYGRGFEIETLESYVYDELDRLVWYLAARDDAASQQTRVYAEEHEDLVTVSEVRNGFGVLTSATYTTYDTRGRAVETVELDDERNETRAVRTWEGRRWADTRLEVFVEEGDGYEAEVVCNDEDPWTERTATYDGWLGERDGEADLVEIQTVTCP